MCRFFSIIAFAIMLSGIFVIPAASAEDNTCWLEAVNSDIYITVWDLDTEGNEMTMIWEGLLTLGNKQKLITSNGKIRYYRNVSGEANSAGIDEMCQNAETVSLP